MPAVSVTLAEAIKTHLAAAFTGAGKPTVARRWRADVQGKDLPNDGAIFVTFGTVEPTARARGVFKRTQAINISSLAKITTDSKDGPANADAFADLHDQIFNQIGPFTNSLATHNLQTIEESMPLEGETNDGTSVLASSFTLVFEQR